MIKNTTKVELEYINCDLCGCEFHKIRYKQPDLWLWVNQFEFPIVECTNCGLVYVNPRPNQDTMKFYYPSDYHCNRNTEKENTRYLAQKKYLPNLDNKKVLDIGCARGDFLAFLKKEYPLMQSYGVDLFSEKVNYCDIDFQNKLLNDCSYKSNYFDTIISFAVFEHLHNPSGYFKESSRILKNQGELIVLVTNSESCYGKYAHCEDIPRHLYHFSEKSLLGYAEKFGLELKSVVFDDEIFDGRGFGTFRYFFSKLLNVEFENYFFKNINIIQKLFIGLGFVIDKIIFSIHWEKKIRRSGIIVAKFKKNVQND